MPREIQRSRSLNDVDSPRARSVPFPCFCVVNPPIECGVTDEYKFYVGMVG